MLVLVIAAEAEERFADGEASVIRDNARQLKFKSGWTGFDD